MIEINNVLISDDIIQQQFVCDLEKCKGACCEQGDAGAPIAEEEKKYINQYANAVKPLLTKEGVAAIAQQGNYVYSKEFGWVTPTIDNGLCVYGFKNDNQQIICAFEQAYNAGKIKWKKPMSCHLFPIRIIQSKKEPALTYLNYEPRESTCHAAQCLGKKLKMPVYVFLKEVLIRKYGALFYEALAAAATRTKK